MQLSSRVFNQKSIAYLQESSIHELLGVIAAFQAK